MEIKVGIRHMNREVVVDSDQSADEVTTALKDALSGASVLELLDKQGRRVVIPADAIGYVEIGQENARPVGFGAL